MKKHIDAVPFPPTVSRGGGAGGGGSILRLVFVPGVKCARVDPPHPISRTFGIEYARFKRWVNSGQVLSIRGASGAFKNYKKILCDVVVWRALVLSRLWALLVDRVAAT